MSTILSRLTEHPRALLCVLVLGLILRMLFVCFHERPLVSDEKEYDQLARNILTEGSYTYGGAPTAYRPIGYPAFVSLVYYVAGQYPIAVKMVQGLLDVLVALMIYHLLLGLGERIQLIGAACWAFYPPAILYSNLLMSESVFTCLLVGLVLFMERLDLGKPGRSLLTGVLFGVLILMKPSFLIVAVMVAAVSPRLRLKVWHLAIAAAGMLLVLAPWLIRNYSISGSVMLSSNGGMNLLIGNNPNATGAYSVAFPAEAIADAKDEFDVDGRAFDYALRYIVQHPAAFLVNSVKKIAHLAESEGGLLVWSFHENPEEAGTRYAAKYASISLLLNLLVNIPYAIVMLLGLVGFVATAQDKLWWILASILVTWLLIHAVYFGGGRFHFPLIPLFVVFAARFLPNLKENLRLLSTSRRIAVAVAVMALLSVWVAEAVVVLNA